MELDSTLTPIKCYSNSLPTLFDKEPIYCGVADAISFFFIAKLSNLKYIKSDCKCWVKKCEKDIIFCL